MTKLKSFRNTLPLFFLLCGMGATNSFAQSGATGSISFVSVSCPTSSSYEGSFTAEWSVSSDAANNVGIIVSAELSDYAIFATGRSGEQGGNWLSYGTWYTFDLESEMDSNYDIDGPGYGLAGAEISC